MYSFLLAGDYFSHLKAIGAAFEWQAQYWELRPLTFNLHYRGLGYWQGKPEVSGGHSAGVEIISGHGDTGLVFVLTANFYGSSFPSDSSQKIRENEGISSQATTFPVFGSRGQGKSQKEKLSVLSQVETNVLKEWDSFWGSVPFYILGFQERVSL